MDYKVAIVGVTGLVGELFLRVMEQRGFPAATIFPYATRHSAGKDVMFAGRSYTVRNIEREALEPCDLALFSAGAEAAKRWAPMFRDRGALVVDNSSAFRSGEDVPLIVPEVNPGAVKQSRGIIANPNCSTIGMAAALYPLHRRFGLRSVVITSLQSVSGAGRRALRELKAQIEDTGAPAEVFPRRIGGNCIPQIGAFHQDGETAEEAKFRDEGRKIMGIPNLQVSATAVRAPIQVGHSLSILARFDREVSVEAALEVLSKAPGIKVFDSAEDYPTPLDAAENDLTLVGRVRQAKDFENSLKLWVTLDNLRKGAAVNAVQIAEIALTEGGVI